MQQKFNSKGVEILLSSKRHKSLRIYASVPKASFKENPWTNFICCQSSTNTFEENETKNFFFNLTSTFFGESYAEAQFNFNGGNFSHKIGHTESNK